MTLSPEASEEHVDEAIRLFNFSTMNAIQSGMVEGVSRGKFSEEVQRVEDVIRKRFSMGSVMSEKRLKDELLKQDFSETAVNRAVYQLISKEILTYRDRRANIARVRS